MTKEQANRIISEHEAMVVGCTYNVLFTNDIVCGLVIDAVEAVRKSPLYRQKTKQEVNQVEREKTKYEKLVNSVIGDRISFFADANDSFLEDVQKHVEVLYWSIKREFDQHGVKHSDVVARVEIARTMADFACKQLDQREAELQEKDARFKRFNIGYIRQTDLYNALRKLTRTLGVPCKIDLNTPDCLLAINILSKKLADAKIIAKAISA